MKISLIKLSVIDFSFQLLNFNLSKIPSMRNQLLTTGPPLILFQSTLKFKSATFIVSFACSHFSGKFSIYKACEVSSKELHIASRLLLKNNLLLSWFQDNKVLRNQIGLEVIQNWEHSYAFHTTRAPLSPRSFHRRFQIWLEFIGTVSKTFSSSFKWNGVKRFWPNWVFGPHSLKRESTEQASGTSVWNKCLGHFVKARLFVIKTNHATRQREDVFIHL